MASNQIMNANTRPRILKRNVGYMRGSLLTVIILFKPLTKIVFIFNIDLRIVPILLPVFKDLLHHCNF